MAWSIQSNVTEGIYQVKANSYSGEGHRQVWEVIKRMAQNVSLRLRIQYVCQRHNHYVKRHTKPLNRRKQACRAVD